MEFGTKPAISCTVPMLILAIIIGAVFVPANHVKNGVTLAPTESVVFAGITRRRRHGLEGGDDAFPCADGM